MDERSGVVNRQPAATTPRFSVVLPTYNREDVVMEAVDSVLRQTFTDLELIIVDDGSTDATWDVLAVIDDPRVRLVTNRGVKGSAGARNFGIGLARAPWVCHIDSDDLWTRDMLAHLALGVETASPAVGVVYGSDHSVDMATGEVRRRRTAELSGYVYKRVLESYFYHHCAAAFRREALVSVGGYDVTLEGVDDTDLQHRLSESWEVLPVPEAVYIYRLGREDQLTQSFAERAKRLRAFCDKHDAVLRTIPVTMVETVGFVMVMKLKGARWLGAVRMFARMLRWSPAAPKVAYQYTRQGAAVVRDHVRARLARGSVEPPNESASRVAS